jgi:hypothetical protein
MNYMLVLTFAISFLFCHAQQSEQTFTVKKRPTETKKEFQRIFDLKLAPGVDTICHDLWLDLSPVKPYYDSVSVFNFKMETFRKTMAHLKTITVGNGGHGILKFYQKQKDGSFKLVYIRNWVIDCSRLNYR